MNQDLVAGLMAGGLLGVAMTLLLTAATKAASGMTPGPDLFVPHNGTVEEGYQRLYNRLQDPDLDEPEEVTAKDIGIWLESEIAYAETVTPLDDTDNRVRLATLREVRETFFEEDPGNWS